MSNQYARNSRSRYTTVVTQEYSIAANATIPDSLDTEVQFDAPSKDIFSESGIVSYAGAGDWTVNKDGIYKVDLTVIWDGNTVGLRRCYVEANENNIEFGGRIQDALSTAVFKLHQGTSLSLPLKVGDTFNVKVQQTSGGNLNLLGSTASSLRYTRVRITYQDGI